jgi:hypothetical protein
MLSLAAILPSVAVLSAAAVLNEPLAGRQEFPASNWWNLDVSGAPVDQQSEAIIGWISGRNTNPSAVRRCVRGPTPADRRPRPLAALRVFCDAVEPGCLTRC